MRRTFLCGAALAGLLLAAQSVSAQTVLFDFETDEQGWGSYGAITTDKGPIDGSSGFGRYHSGDFSVTDEGNFGIVDVSPLALNLSAYGGISVDARFVDVPGFDPFVGVKELDMIVATGADETEEEFFAPKHTMTDVYQTFSVPFSQFISTLDQGTPTLADLANIRIKFVVYNSNGTGLARFDYDQVTGLAPAVEDADFNNDNIVNGSDFLIWQRNFGSGTTLAQGDANGSGSVNAADLAIWKAKFGTVGSAAAVAAVPEPAAGLLASLGLAALVYRRRGSR
jgi:hypothetical protein